MESEVKVAVVTGGAQGIGKAISLELMNKRYAVIVADIDREEGEELVLPYGKIFDLHYRETDVSDEHSVRELFDSIEEQFDRLDLLVNNAADAGAYNTEITECSLEEWEAKIRTNLTSTFLCAKHASRLLRRTRGSIVNLASIRALMTEPDGEAYSASKGGVVGLTHALANSLGPEVRVNAVSPGWIEVRDWQKSSQKKDPQLREIDHEQHPVGRVGRPGDVAHLVSFLGSDRAGFITGQNIVIDGGISRKLIFEE